MRRRWVVRVKRLSEYAVSLGGSLLAFSLVAFIVARSTVSDDAANAIRIFTEGAAVARQAVGVPLLPGDTVEIPEGAVVEAEDSVHVRLDSPPSADVIGPLVRTAAAWSAFDAGGAIRIARVPGGWQIQNGTREDLEAGTLFDRPSAYAVPRIPAGKSVTFSRPLPMVPESPMAVPFSGDNTLFITRGERGWVIVRAGTK